MKITREFNDFSKIGDNIKLKTYSRTNYQIQMSLAICNLDVCHLLYYCPYEFNILHIKVMRDDKFINQQLKKIVKFFNCIGFKFYQQNL